ncbi:MAG: insulinase family protein [Clostridiales bacterium]|nr:insulinase family protein [Clostridiales bacterium]
MFEQKRLKNGIRTIVEDMPHMNSIAMAVFVGIGSRYENEVTNGAAHFIEHMLFKGTYRRTAEETACEMDELGGQLNAYTTKEYTCFYFKVLSEHFEKALDILSDMLLNSKFDSDDIKRERTVIDEEISVYEDNPEDVVFDRLQYEVWNKKGLGLEILGTHDTIAAFDRDFLTDYKDKNYRTDNMVISVAGKFDKDKLYESLERAFSPLKPCEYRLEAEPGVYIPKRVAVKRSIEQLHLCLAFPAPAVIDGNYPLSVLNTAAGGGMSSRLFQKIREEKGLCYSVYSTCSLYSDASMFMIYCGLNPKNTEEAVKLCKEELLKLKEEKMPQAELERIKNQIKSGFLLSDEATSSRCSRYGRNILLRGNCRNVEQVLSEIDKIDGKIIKSLAEEIFDFDKMSISVVGKGKIIKDISELKV